MLYLDPTTKDNGALRVIPGSHRLPFYTNLEPLEPQKGNTCPDLFGVPGFELLGYPVESQPGDVLFFNQTLFHAVFNGWRGRRVIALKFAANPTTDAHIASLWKHGQVLGVFPPHELFVNSDRPRLRRMVAKLVELGPEPCKNA